RPTRCPMTRPCAPSSVPYETAYSGARISRASRRRPPRIPGPPPMAGISAGPAPALSRRSSSRPSPGSRTTKSTSRSRPSSVGISCRCSVVGVSTTPTRSSADRPSTRSAPASPTRKLSYGCGRCGTKPTSSTSRRTPRIALTSGEPAGVGPELCLALAASPWPCELVCLADMTLLEERARRLDLTVTFRPYAVDAAPAARAAGTLVIAHHALAVPSDPGTPEPANAPYVLALLDRAIDGALGGEFDALVTAPVHKGVINDAGIPFSGHTEYLA